MTQKAAPQPSTSTPNNNATTTASTGPGPAPTSGPNNQQSTSTGAAPATGTGPDTNRGLPYYEKLRRELRDTLQRKRMMDKSMVLPHPIYLQPRLIRKKDRMLSNMCTGPTRRPNLPLRTILPRRNHGRKHHQGLRQLHQGILIHDGIQRRRAILSRDCRWGTGDETQGCGGGFRKGVL